MEGVHGQQWQHDVPVERERGDDSHEGHRQPQVLIAPHVEEAFSDLALLLGHSLVEVQLVRIDHRQGDQHSHERHAVGGEAPADADARDEPRRQRRPDHARTGDQRAVQADSVAHVLFVDQLGDHHAPRGVVEGVGHAREAGQQVHPGDRLVVGQHE